MKEAKYFFQTSGFFHLSLFLLANCVIACSSTPKLSPVVPKEQVRYELASHRCQGATPTCICRNPDDTEDQVEQVPVPENHRRFEVVLQSLNPALFVEISGLPFQFRPNGEALSNFCWYVDIPLETKTISLRTREFESNTTNATLVLREYQPENSWVSVFEFRCGSPSFSCTPDDLTQEKERILTTSDRVAKSQIETMQWQGSTLEERYTNLDLTFTLKIGQGF